MCGANPHPLYYKEEEMTIMCQVMLNSISIMGIFSLDLTKPLSLSFEKCSDEEVQNYMSIIYEFIMEE